MIYLVTAYGFAVATLGVGAIALTACVAPALRAVRSDPAAALRAE